MSPKKTSPRMPVLFVGHGSPMNALADNTFTRKLFQLGAEFPRPRAIVMVSAHWMSEGSWVLGMDQPKTIHDFYGFPEALFNIQYSAPGSPETAKWIQESLPGARTDLNAWGFDHGAWAILKHLYPKADVPTIQLSLDMTKKPEEHFELGRQLAKLRDQGVLIIGSGNVVHNLRRISWDENAKPFDWALDFDAWIKAKLEARDFNAINRDFHKSAAGQLSVPTLDHFLPIQYILGAASANDELKFEFEEMQNGSIAMRSFSFRARPT